MSSGTFLSGSCLMASLDVDPADASCVLVVMKEGNIVVREISSRIKPSVSAVITIFLKKL